MKVKEIDQEGSVDSLKTNKARQPQSGLLNQKNILRGGD